ADTKPAPAPAAPAPAATSKSTLPSGWKETVSEEGGYAVALPPGTPLTPSVPPIPGAKPPAMSAVALEGDRGMFSVMAMTLPAAAPPNALPAFLASVKEGAVRAVPGAKLVNENKIQFGEYPGLELIADSPKGKAMLKVYAVKERVYILCAMPLAK